MLQFLNDLLLKLNLYTYSSHHEHQLWVAECPLVHTHQINTQLLALQPFYTLNQTLKVLGLDRRKPSSLPQKFDLAQKLGRIFLKVISPACIFS